MNQKIILVTGASDGIGKETAKTLASQGHTVILHGRNKQKTEAVFNEIRRETGNQNVSMLIADFLSLAEVRRFAMQIRQQFDHLDVLINNAGAQFTERRETTNKGYEKTMTINVFVPLLLTTLLLDVLKKSPSARVVTVSSASHAMSGKPFLDDIELKQNYTMSRAYALSKLYVIWMMRHFVKEMQQAGVRSITFNSVHPASAPTSLGREATKSLKWRIIYFLWKPIMISVAKGASSSIRAAVAPELEGVTGKYFGPKGEEKVNEKYYSVENEEIVWKYCQEVIRPYLG
ncbi:SDR family NAD(P)-dependent oxidoreductase [Chitinophaga sancti]|uniref:NAD(P)-dependent dehydrogenase, short-chain alcohol dehydrogenase family n=1 Tax=Chitinophaga sancti TaxID=1004 RepID=A0A1K1SCB6_9BACT|nr:SDR family NAD(P)-dependent oxidoreductase [Chitinophaga sancti]WQD63565.1 SDR family NAD(P)-dependent oxidoreductase [Chitinophaga sancti]WQG90809.1 SDR family NAD(P)-dependent oxidoreductase [Chitinophaga sancti]SFW81748.1 NAD(P)-dependent dehydrogenase, short-chain alcohol dehydrogenase family [Chitinophaga sancti]